jgi:hypothetical protein
MLRVSVALGPVTAHIDMFQSSYKLQHGESFSSRNTCPAVRVLIFLLLERSMQ